jgi:hypothetical protein
MSINNMPVLGVNGFNIDIDLCIAVFRVWIDTLAACAITGKNEIVLTPVEFDKGSEPAILHIDGKSMSCSVKQVAYVGRKHAYLVEVEFELNKKYLEPYKHNEGAPKSIKSRFDILDI